MQNPLNNDEKKSILDQIITNFQAEEVAKLDAVEIAKNLFEQLNERERDVLSRRFGLSGDTKETLENIGNVHKLTRERIRQIETSGVKKLRSLKNLEEHISGLRKVINQLLEEHGGMMEKEYLLNNLVNFSTDGTKNKPESINLHKNHLDFLISKLLHDHFEEVINSSNFKDSFKLKHQVLDHLEELANELVAKIKEVKQIFITDDLINLSTELESYKNNQEKFNPPSNLDISNILDNSLFKEDAEKINNNKVLYSILQASKQIEQNKFGHWGIEDWREVKPKTINDKIYLILKNHGKPMHFVEITDQINKINFDDKGANAATVHNELILDEKYVLVGRGLYSLKEWGYQKGTVVDVIKDILNKTSEPLSREQIIEKVLEQRLVKKATIILALMDKNSFEKVGGKYQLKK
ncbi:MAG: RNA polymerase sigma factor [Parcubacteria group bacterium GW2011_GWE2_38_18]|nr:MAG: RNA polymerase sigma factor [Parcubacteria group bacterium GW2011_GWE2_38_18]